MQTRYSLALSTLLFVFPTFAFADDSATESSLSVKTSVLAEPGDLVRERGPFEYGGALTLETFRSLDADKGESYGGWYVVKPTVEHKASKVSAFAQLAYTQPFSSGTSADSQASFDNPTGTIAKAWEDLAPNWIESVSIGLTGTLPGNKAADELTFRGSVGPFIRAEKKFGRMDLAQTVLFQHRFFGEDQIEEGPQNFRQAYKALTELSYRISEKLNLNAAITFIDAVSSANYVEWGNRVVYSADYKFSESVSTSLGWMTERGMSTSEGLSDTLVSSQAFFDLILEI